MRWFLTERLLWLYIICKLCSYKHQIYTGNKEDFVTANKENIIKIIKVTTSSWLPSSSNGKTNKSLCTFCQGKNSENLVITGSFHSRVEHKLESFFSANSTARFYYNPFMCVWKGGGGREAGESGPPTSCTCYLYLYFLTPTFSHPVPVPCKSRDSNKTQSFNCAILRHFLFLIICIQSGLSCSPPLTAHMTHMHLCRLAFRDLWHNYRKRVYNFAGS